MSTRLAPLRDYGWLVGAAAFVVLTTNTAWAEHPRFYNLEGFGTWLDGNPETTAVTEEGEITLATPARVRFEDAAATFSAAAAWGDEVAVARVDDGQVVLVDRAGKTRDLFKAEQTLITAMAVARGDLFIATGPPAKIHRVTRKGVAKTYYTPDASFVWDMATAKDGTLYLATGEPGTVTRVDPKGNGVVLFEPEQEHMRSVAFDADMGIFAGGGERGILFRAPAKKPKNFRALFDSGHPEITGLAVLGNAAYLSAVTGAQTLAAEEGNEQHGGKSAKGPEVRSQLVRVSVDGTAEVLAGSNDEAIFDVAVDSSGAVLVCTGATGRDDPRGRIYSVRPEKRLISMVYQSPSRRITHLLNLPRGAMAAIAGGGGRVVHLAGGLAKKGEFFTQPFDTVITSRFGIMQIFSESPAGTKVTGAVRTGQTKTPDDTWTEWSEEIAAPGNERVRAENGRYMQIRLTLKGNGKATPRVSRVRLAFLRQNLRPFVREVVALRKGLALLPIVREENKNKNINLGESASKEARGQAGKRSPQPRARQVVAPGALTLKWLAEDPNGDMLRYDLMVRDAGGGEKPGKWRTLEEELLQPFYTIHSSQLPDGHYQFKVRATDELSNPSGLERSDTRESRAVLIDNTPPHLDPLVVSISGGRVTVRSVIADAVGPILSAEYALDGERFQVLAPDDAVLDGPGESFTIRLGALSSGQHTITVRVRDEGDNEGFAQKVFTIP